MEMIICCNTKYHRIWAQRHHMRGVPYLDPQLLGDEIVLGRLRDSLGDVRRVVGLYKISQREQH